MSGNPLWWKIIFKREKGNGSRCQTVCLYLDSVVWSNKRSRLSRRDIVTRLSVVSRRINFPFPLFFCFYFFLFHIFFPSGDVTINRGDNREYLVFIAGHAAAFFHCEIGSWQPEKTKTPGNKKQRRIISITTLIKIQMKHLKTVRAE